MDQIQFKKIALKKLDLLKTDDLIIQLKKLSNNFSFESQLIFNLILDILMNRLNESDFLKLCNQL